MSGRARNDHPRSLRVKACTIIHRVSFGVPVQTESHRTIVALQGDGPNVVPNAASL